MKPILCRTLMLAFAAGALWAQPSCSQLNSSVYGSYALSGSGTIGGSPFTLVGKITFDGQGKGTATYTFSVSGLVSRGVTATAVYTVNADCTGSKTLTDSGGNVLHFDFVTTPDGSKITWIETDSFTNVLGAAVRLGS
jgi:hypothetical protein